MQTEKDSNGNLDCGYDIFCNGYGDDCKMVDRAQGYNREATNPMSFSAKLFPVTSSSPSSPSSQSLPSSYSPGVGFIEHRVSKLDTLAGVAIKYGVEVDSLFLFIHISIYLFFFFIILLESDITFLYSIDLLTIIHSNWYV